MAARALLESRTANDQVPDNALADARAMEATPEQMAALEAYLAALDGIEPELTFNGIWPAHVPAVNALVLAGSQWRTTMAQVFENGRVFLVTRFLGLDYAGAAVAWAASGLVLNAADFTNLRILESATASLMNGVNP
jgi:hypothetical protein